MPDREGLQYPGLKGELADVFAYWVTKWRKMDCSGCAPGPPDSNEVYGIGHVCGAVLEGRGPMTAAESSMVFVTVRGMRLVESILLMEGKLSPKQLVEVDFRAYLDNNKMCLEELVNKRLAAGTITKDDPLDTILVKAFTRMH